MKENLKKLYYEQNVRFPIIGAVLEGKADGKVLYDDYMKPEHILVISKFGFCQELYQEYSLDFFDKIKNIIESNKRPKLRMYHPSERMIEFLNQKAYVKEARRKRYIFEKEKGHEIKIQCDYTIRPMRIEDIRKEDFGLTLSSRYYRDDVDFIENAMPLIACSPDGNYMGIIYSAGNDESMREVDIFTKKEYRKKGVASQLVAVFLNECERNNKIAVWDCYSNLEASYRLAEKMGFRLVEEYSFYNIEQPK